MQLTLRVTHADGSTEDVTAKTPDILDFEEKFTKSFLNLMDDISYTDMCWLAWSAAKRAGSAGDDFRAWASNIDVTFPTRDEKSVDQPVPLGQTASTTDS